jgi:bifunctional non-homologous end joining protein LigD
MLATLVDKPFDRAGWIFEIKWDGYRIIAEVDKGHVRLFSRNGLSFTERVGPRTTMKCPTAAEAGGIDLG